MGVEERLKGENGKMKSDLEQTEIEAPYELPEGWKWCRLPECVSIVTGKKDANYGTPDGKYLFFTCAEQPLRCDDYSFEGESLLLPGNGANVGQVIYYDGQFEVYQRTYVLQKTNESILLKYLYYHILGFWKNYNLDKQYGSATNYIKMGNFLNYLFPLPPTLAEQQRIVNRIESMFVKLDEAKEKAQDVVDGFETRKAAILHKAFTGELTAKWRKENGVSDDSWVEKTLGEICSEIKIGPFGSLLHEDDYIENGIPLVNPKHISNQLIKPDTKVSISNEKAEELKSYRLLKNDIVLGRRGEMGRCAPVSENENGWLCGTGSMILRLKPEYQARIYSILISSHKSVLYFEENAVGTTLKNLNEKIVKNLPMPIISLPEQQEIVRILDIVLEKESRAKEASQTVLDQIALLKKSILARAFRGEL